MIRENLDFIAMSALCIGAILLLGFVNSKYAPIVDTTEDYTLSITLENNESLTVEVIYTINAPQNVVASGIANISAKDHYILELSFTADPESINIELWECWPNSKPALSTNETVVFATSDRISKTYILEN